MIDALAVFMTDADRARLDEQVGVIALEIGGKHGDAVVAALGADEVQHVIDLAVTHTEALKPVRNLLMENGDLARVLDGIDETLVRFDLANHVDLEAPYRLLGFIPKGRVADNYFRSFSAEVSTLRARARYLIDCLVVIDRIDQLANEMWGRLGEIAQICYGVDRLADAAPADARVRDRRQDVARIADLATCAYAEARQAVETAESCREAIRAASKAADSLIHAAAVLADALDVTPLNGVVAQEDRRDIAGAKADVLARLGAARTTVDDASSARERLLRVVDSVTSDLGSLVQYAPPDLDT